MMQLRNHASGLHLELLQIQTHRNPAIPVLTLLRSKPRTMCHPHRLSPCRFAKRITDTSLTPDHLEGLCKHFSCFNNLVWAPPLCSPSSPHTYIDYLTYLPLHLPFSPLHTRGTQLHMLSLPFPPPFLGELTLLTITLTLHLSH